MASATTHALDQLYRPSPSLFHAVPESLNPTLDYVALFAVPLPSNLRLHDRHVSGEGLTCLSQPFPRDARPLH